MLIPTIITHSQHPGVVGALETKCEIRRIFYEYLLLPLLVMMKLGSLLTVDLDSVHLQLNPIIPANTTAVMSPDSQTHISSTAHSPYTDQVSPTQHPGVYKSYNIQGHTGPTPCYCQEEAVMGWVLRLEEWRWSRTKTGYVCFVF